MRRLRGLPPIPMTISDPHGSPAGYVAGSLRARVAFHLRRAAEHLEAGRDPIEVAGMLLASLSRIVHATPPPDRAVPSQPDRRTPTMTTTPWTKSSFSGANNANCVQARRHGERIEVRNSNNPDGGTLFYTDGEWAAFLDGAKGGEFDSLLNH